MKILLEIICGFLFRIGGTAKDEYPIPGVDKKGARVVGIPVVLGISLCIYLKSVIPLLCIGSYQILRLGYSVPGDKWYSLGSIFKIGWLTRGMYGLICGFIGPLPLVVFSGLPTETYIGYALLNGGIAGALDYLKAPDWLIEIAQGLGFAWILFLLKGVYHA